MFLPPSIGSKLAPQRQHDMQAHGEQRQLRQLRTHACASRHAEQTGRRGVRHVHIFG
jgi:hypothetical protein